MYIVAEITKCRVVTQREVHCQTWLGFKLSILHTSAINRDLKLRQECSMLIHLYTNY